MAANDRLLDEWKLRGNSEPLLPIPWSAAGMRNGNNLKIVSSLLAIDHDKREPPQQISSGFEWTECPALRTFNNLYKRAFDFEIERVPRDCVPDTNRMPRHIRQRLRREIQLF